jgi:ABC-type Zn uptake system ZnuABC Zn-binding protein ZnuA
MATTDGQVLATALLALCGVLLPGASGAAPLRVLCTTFPMYQLTRNVGQGREGLAVSLLLPAQLGCPHDYALTPQDMRRLSRADLLVVNGLGLEDFLGAPIREANPRAVVLEPAAGIADVLFCGEAAGRGHGDAEPQGEAEGPGDGHDRQTGEGHEHHHAGANPHLFASPRQAARLAGAIAAGLGKADPEGAALYARNAQAYADRLNRLADEMVALGQGLRNRRIVTQHGVFDYLARDMGLEVVAVVQAHAGQDPSAAEMLALVKTIRERGAAALFTEPQYPPEVGKTIAGETGIPVASLDPAASGPENAPLDYYETAMRRNLSVLMSVLGNR